MAGFTTGNSSWLLLAPDYMECNVQVERGIARSTLQIFKGIQKLKGTAVFQAFKQPGGFSYGAITTQVLQIFRTDTLTEEYRILINMANNLEVLENIGSKTMECVLLSSHSLRNLGDKINLSGRLQLRPFEAVVLRWIAV